jgi:N,N'-diacetyllegionaminate synthase
MKNKPPKLIVEVANSHNGSYNLLKKTIDELFKINYKNRAIKLKIFKFDKIASRDFSYYNIYEKLFFNKKQWFDLIDYIYLKKEKIYLDIYDDYGIEVLKNKIDYIEGIKIQFSHIIDFTLLSKLKFIKKKNINIIINITTFTKDEIKKIFFEYSKLSKNIILQFGHQSYPTNLNQSGLNKLMYLKKNYPKISFADHFDYQDNLSKKTIQISKALKIDILEKHILYNREISKYDYQSALTVEEFNQGLKYKIVNIKKMINLLIASFKSFHFKGEKKLKKQFISQINLNKINKDRIVHYSDLSFKRSKKFFLLNNKIDFKKNFYSLKKNKNNLSDFRKLKIGAIIMARNNSKRLQGKIFKKIGNDEMLTHCIKNTKKISYLDQIIIATTSKIEDKKITKIAKKNNVKIFRGSENNVMKRYHDAGKKYNLDVILRITGDCPFISPDVMNILLKDHFRKNADFSLPKKSTIGSAGEIVNFKSLQYIYNIIKNNKKITFYSEYFKFFFKNKRFNQKYNLTNLPKKLVTDYRLTVDYSSDLKVLNKLFKILTFKKKEVNLINLINLIKKEPHIVEGNNINTVIYRQKSFINNINKVINEK